MEQSTQSPEDASFALKRFQQQWQDEIKARNQKSDKKLERPPQPRRLTAEGTVKLERSGNKAASRHPLADVKDDDGGPDEVNSAKSGLIEKIEGLRVRDVDEDDFSGASTKEPQSALEHYERAVEKESQGNLGESLLHYRKAYRMDDRVDQTYKKKHFPAKSKPANTHPPPAALTVPNTAHHPPKVDEKTPFADTVSSYAELEIPNAEPMIEGDTPPPCPIRKLPAEVLVGILQQVAISDPAVFARLALVCKRLAYHVYRENNVWRRLALGPEFGLESQRYQFATDIQGRETIYQALHDSEDEEEEMQLPPVNEALFPKSTDWRDFFHSHPRIRFSGVYISTVNYTRAGGVSATPATWASSVHIVTYYRYLRFFRDGTVISLLTVNEPVEVVHHLTKENLRLVRSGGKDAPTPLRPATNVPAPILKDGQSLPPTAQNILKHALRGRWRMCHPSLDENTAGTAMGANRGIAGDLHIETEGVGPRYMYTLHLGIRSGSKSKNAAKNNKLMWKGFWSYNILTDDWSEFHLKNDKAFWFSRVKSYGLGY